MHHASRRSARAARLGQHVPPPGRATAAPVRRRLGLDRNFTIYDQRDRRRAGQAGAGSAGVENVNSARAHQRGHQPGQKPAPPAGPLRLQLVEHESGRSSRPTSRPCVRCRRGQRAGPRRRPDDLRRLGERPERAPVPAPSETRRVIAREPPVEHDEVGIACYCLRRPRAARPAARASRRPAPR